MSIPPIQRHNVLHRVLPYLFLACICLLATYLVLQEKGRMGPQSKANLIAASKPTLRRALGEYTKLWPPAYPAALYVVSKWNGTYLSSLWDLFRFGGFLSLQAPFCHTWHVRQQRSLA